MAVGIAVVLASLALRDSDANPVLVRGEARADVRGGVFDVTPPYFVAVYRGDPSGPEAGTDPVAEGDTDEDGRFVLRADLSDDETRDLYVYVSAYGYEPACAYAELPSASPRRGRVGRCANGWASQCRADTAGTAAKRRSLRLAASRHASGVTRSPLKKRSSVLDFFSNDLLTPHRVQISLPDLTRGRFFRPDGPRPARRDMPGREQGSM
jgi:hypothetical protein